jgi:hypothetical protein
MSAQIKKFMEIVVMALAIGAACSAAAKLYYLTPHQIARMEADIAALQASQRQDRELLVRMEERLIAIQKALAEPKR